MSPIASRHNILHRSFPMVVSFSGPTRSTLRTLPSCSHWTVSPNFLSSLVRRPLLLPQAPSLYHSRFLTDPALKKPNIENTPLPSPPSSPQPTKNPRTTPTIRENIYTIPNALTISRIVACPVLGWAILKGDFVLATSLLAYAGVTDWVSGIFHTPRSLTRNTNKLLSGDFAGRRLCSQKI